jgi:hypothetical protein
MLAGFGINDFPAMGLQGFKRPRLVPAHGEAVADGVVTQDGGEAAIHHCLS